MGLVLYHHLLFCSAGFSSNSHLHCAPRAVCTHAWVPVTAQQLEQTTRRLGSFDSTVLFSVLEGGNRMQI